MRHDEDGDQGRLPNKAFAFDAAANSFTWKVVGAPTDKLTYRAGYSDPTEITVSGQTKMTATYKAKDFNGKVSAKKCDDTVFVYGTVRLRRGRPVRSETGVRPELTPTGPADDLAGRCPPSVRFRPRPSGRPGSGR